MSSCPADDIGCILNYIANTTSEANRGNKWDPLSFGFTAPVGIVAALFAVLAVYQAILATSASRLKARKGAIGPYVKFRERRWKRSEWMLRFKTYARVPYISIPSLQNGRLDRRGRGWYKEESQYLRLLGVASDHEQASNPEHELIGHHEELQKSDHLLPISSTGNAQMLGSSLRTWLSGMARLARKMRKRATSDEEQAKVSSALEQFASASEAKDIWSGAAGWLKLLDSFCGSMHHFVHDPEHEHDARIPGHLRSSLKHRIKLPPCNTDAVPSDLTAMPTLGTIESIVTIAAFAGCDNISIDLNGLPTARGENTELSFREHAQLGTVAVFYKLPGKDTYRRNGTLPDRLRESVVANHSHEGLPYCDHTFNILLFGSATWPRVYPYTEHKVYDTVQLLRTNSRIWKTDDLELILTSMCIGLQSMDKTFHVSLSLCSKFWKKTAPLAKPKVSMLRDGLFDGDRILPLASRDQYAPIADYRQSSTKSWCSSHRFFAHPLRPGLKAVKLPTDRSALHQIYKDLVSEQTRDNSLPPRLYFEDQSKHDDRCLIVSPPVLAYCLRFMQGKERFSRLPTDLKALIRAALRHELHQLDVVLNMLWNADGEKSKQNMRELVLQPIMRQTRERTAEADSTSRGADVIEANAGNVVESAFRNEAEQQDYLDSVLQCDDYHACETVVVYRAIVMAAFLSTAADISCVAGTDLGKRVVYML